MRPWPTRMLGVAALLLSACAPVQVVQPKTPPLNLTGPAPDVVILAMSGRCGIFCTAPGDNWDYFTEYGALDELAQVFQQAGYRVQAASYSASPQETYRSPLSRREQRGYAALSRDYRQLGATWGQASGGQTMGGQTMGGQPAPRVVLLGHSHGAAWLHHLATVYRDQPVEFLIDLDDTCFLWPTDQLSPPYDESGGLVRGPDPAEEPLPVATCLTRRVAGERRQGNDVTPWNVRYNLEVHSAQKLSLSPTAVWGINPSLVLRANLRPDGSHTGLEVYDAPLDNHSTQPRGGSQSLAWVSARIAALIRDWPAPLPAPPAPPALSPPQ